MAFKYHFTVGSRDALTVYVVDEVLDANDNVVTETAVDLSSATITLKCEAPSGASLGPLSMTARNPQTGDDLGKADYVWAADDLDEAGEWEAQLTVTIGSIPHIQPGTFKFRVSDAL